ncbi:hypothetical protein SPBR_05832 [Sporothrix brasiliensis 5110]|uniref:DUF6546 domain-containing protein n=1 Tax=Sporothrix brasiliensis 5110 TaxID=1398154 RepID=A0A0C2FTB3_9PEZI|nr:uncharacterized protein SPBR_05832 [Sporothrix brasiliensis 5110]KIH94263.1 hypothetical protein SPBR_05832 [Sporothrix brasiliensis 5110]
MFEPVIFSTLMVYGDELDDFANCVVGEPGSPKHARLNYLMHLHFHCRLLPYRIDEFNKEEPSNTVRIDNLRFEDQIMGLFAVLAKWDGPGENAKLLLELSAASSGDTFHKVSNFRLNEYYRYGRGEETHHRPNCDIPLLPHSGVPQDVSDSVDDPLPTRRMAGISKDGFGRLGREWQWHAFHTKDTPSIPIVRGLTVSLRFHRVISHTFLTAMILTKLPNLKDIRIEQWRCLDLKGTMAGISLEDSPMIKSLRSLRIYYEPTILRGRPEDDILTAEQEVLRDNHFLDKFVRATRHLKVLALTRPVTATEMFLMAKYQCPKQCWADLYKGPYFYPSLIKVALWEPGLSEEHKDTTVALMAAGRMAVQMPRLRIMELWNMEEPYIFRYEATPCTSTITMLAPYNPRPAITTACFDLWEAAANNHYRSRTRKLEINACEVDSQLDAGNRACVVSFLRRLKLCNEIIDPRSLCQLEVLERNAFNMHGLGDPLEQAGEDDQESMETNEELSDTAANIEGAADLAVSDDADSS